MSGNLRKNGSVKIHSEWSDFLAELDVKIIICGKAEDIFSWQSYSHFCGAPFYRLYLPLKGEFRIHSLETSVILAPGSFYLVPDTIPLKYQGISPSDHYWIHFVSRQLQKLPFYEPLSLPVDRLDRVPERFAEIVEHCRSFQELSHQILAKCGVEQLLIPFIETLSARAPSRDLPREQLFRLVDYIDLNIGRGIAVDELAEQAKMTRGELTALFVNHFGMAPKQYITTRRLYHAKLLLLQSNLQIKEIAWRCGWKDEYFFFRIFRKYMQTTPANYRKHQIY